ncbi:VP3 [Callinectes sapidus reovirus 2]|uniref:VP3 n=1 Tax=Callinectes sapidus reovirus 2 TaxID=2789658 RepID=A0A7U3QES4_9REOV|nr:VP3 [Callinectes sapidus reovirus 2]
MSDAIATTIVQQILSELNTLTFKINEKKGKYKNYEGRDHVSNAVYYSLGDGYQAALDGQAIHIKDAETYMRFQQLGFRTDDHGTGFTSVLRGMLPKLIKDRGITEVQGVDAQTMRILSLYDLSGVSVKDMYVPVTGLNFIDDFRKHCENRLSMPWSRSLYVTLKRLAKYYENFENTFADLSGITPTLLPNFEKSTCGFSKVRIAKLEPTSYVLFGPPGIGKSTIVREMNGLDLEGNRPIEDAYKRKYQVIGAAAYQPEDFDPVRFTNVLLYMDQSGYEERRMNRDLLNVAKADQPHMYVSQFMQGDGYDHVLYSSVDSINNLLKDTQVKELELECEYPCKAPAIGSVLGDGVKKNTMSTVGLVCKHNMLITIGDSPGPHYRNYPHMIGNTYSWDPLPPEYDTKHVLDIFTYDDIPKLISLVEANADKQILLRMDIRADRPDQPQVTKNEKSVGVNRGVSQSFEMNVHNDNLLMSAVARAVCNYDNLSFSIKLRPSYSDEFSGYTLDYGCDVLLIPLPFTAPTTMEMNVVRLRSGIKRKSGLVRFISYTDLIKAQTEFIALKKLCAPLYTHFLSDAHYSLMIDEDEFKPVNNSFASFSMSNINNPSPYSIIIPKNFLYTYPYGVIGSDETYFVTRNRKYKDYTVSLKFEIFHEELYVTPLNAIGGGRNVGVHGRDITTVIVSDFPVTSFNQPVGTFSTQVVKLVSAIMKKRFPKWHETDNSMREIAMDNISKRYKNLIIRVGGGVALHNTNVMTSSGHVMYILLGSLLGIPYGFYKYLRELEVNIQNEDVGYERKSGSRV